MTTVAIVHELLADFDYYGAAALVAAFGAILASVFSFLNGRKVNQVHEHVENVQAAVSTGNGYTVGELAERIDARAAGDVPPEGSIKSIPPGTTP